MQLPWKVSSSIGNSNFLMRILNMNSSDNKIHVILPIAQERNEHMVYHKFHCH